MTADSAAARDTIAAHPNLAELLAPQPPLPALGSVTPDVVRTRRVLAIALIIVSLASVVGVVVGRWLDGRDHAQSVRCAVSFPVMCGDSVAARASQSLLPAGGQTHQERHLE